MCWKNGSIRNVRLISKFMTSHPCKQTIGIYTLLNISRSKYNQTMKFSQLIEYNKINIVLQKKWKKWRREPSSTPIFAFLKSFICVVCSLVSIYFDSLILAYDKNKLYKTLDDWSRDMINFDILEKGLGIISPTHFVYGFLTKMFFMLYYINWPNFIVRLSLLLEILGNTCILIISFSDCNVINFEINLIFLIKPFFYLTKKVRQKFKCYSNEKSF